MSALESFRPAPERFWIRYRPRRWPGARGPWTDLARAATGSQATAESELSDGIERPLDDVLYLPPVDPGLEGDRRQLAAASVAAGTPVILQRLPGAAGPATGGALELWDLLPALLRADTALLAALPSDARTVWPLVAGLTDRDELVENGLNRLHRSGAATVQPLALELSPAARRKLAESGDAETFDRLFHGKPPSERAFARKAAARGLETFVRRPLPTAPPRLVARRRVAGELRLAAELAHRLERPEVEIQKLLRAARWIDREDHDVAALAEEGNLAIVDWIDEGSRAVVEDVVACGRSRLVEALLAEYHAPSDAG